MHARAIRKFLYGSAYVWEIIHELKLVDYLPVHTHRPYNNYHCFMGWPLSSVPLLRNDDHFDEQC